MHMPGFRWIALLFLAALAATPGRARAWRFVYPNLDDQDGPKANAVAAVAGTRMVVAAGRVDFLGTPHFAVTVLEPNRGQLVFPFFDFAGAGEAFDVAASSSLVAVAGVVHEAQTSDDFAVTALLPNGLPRWSARLDGAATCGDRAAAVVVDPAGDVVAAGTLADQQGRGFAVVKLDGNSGAEAWRVVIPGGDALAVGVDAAGTVVAAGELDGALAVVSLSGLDGSERWRHATTSGRALSLALDGAGDVLVAGDLAATCGTQPCAVRKLAGASGAVVWDAPFRAPGSAAGAPRAVIATPGRDAIVAGGDDGAMAAVRLRAASGSEAWRYVGPADGAANAVAMAPNGDVVVAGSSSAPPGGPSLGERLVVARLDVQDGTARWTAAVDADESQNVDRALDVATDDAGDVLASGILTPPGQPESYGVVKLAGADGSDFTGHCGDGVLDAGEECDDGNLDAFDCCSPTCRFEQAGSFCFDTNPCTDDACDGAGHCVATPNTNPCDADGNACTDDACRAGSCVPVGTALDGTPCGASGPCFEDTCVAGACVEHDFNGQPCDDGNACTIDFCTDGLCQPGELAPDGAPCEDGTDCTVDDSCQQGVCAPGTPAVAGTACESDGNVCTDDVCDTGGRCVHVPNTAPCDDGEVCTTGDQCSQGSCVPGTGGPTTTTTSTTSTTAPSSSVSTTTSTTSTTSTSTSTAPSTTTSTTLAVTTTTPPTSTSSTSSTTSSTSVPGSSTTTTTVPPAGCTTDRDCDDRDPCNGGEACVAGACVRATARAACEPGTPLAAVTVFRGDAVVLLDARARAVLATIAVPGAPWGIAWHPDGSRLWVTSRRGDSVHEIDVAARRVSRTVAVGREPLGIAVDPSGGRLFVANHGSGTVTVLDTTSLSTLATVSTGRGAAAVAVHPAGTRAYVSNYEDGTVSVLDAVTGALLHTVGVAALPIGIAVHPDGSRLYVTSFDARAVTILGTASDTVVGSIRVGRRPVGVAFAADGRRAFVTGSRDDVVSIVDAARDRVVDRVRVVGQPLGVAVDGSDGSVWVAASDRDAVAVLGADGETQDTVPVAGTPVGFGAFLTTPRGTCPAPPLRCDDGDVFTRDACAAGTGCTHADVQGAEALRVAVEAIGSSLDDPALAPGTGLDAMRARLPALRAALSAVQAGGGRDASAVLAHRLKRVAAAAARVQRAHAGGGAVARVLDGSREALRRLRRAAR